MSGAKRSISLIVLTLSSCFVAGCSSDLSCSSEEDCFDNESCVEGICRTSFDPNDARDDAGEEADAEGSGGDMSAATDAGAPNNGGANNGANNGGSNNGANNGGTDPACVVDPLATCDDPAETTSNNTWTDAERVTGSIGCKDNDDRDAYDAVSGSIHGKICQREPADFYAFTFLTCETVPLIFELTVTPTTECDIEDVELTLNRAGAEITCDSLQYDIECVTEGNSKIARLGLPLYGDSQLEPWYFGISKFGRDDIQYEYELKYELK